MVDISFTQNRELSWLKFNERVLEEAQDSRVPLLERLKFLSIFDSNLDEFFMVRVGSLTDLSHLDERVIDNKSLMDQNEQLAAIMERTRALYKKKDATYDELIKHARSIGITFVDTIELGTTERAFVSKYFFSSILPLLNYQVVDRTHPLPHITNLGIFVLYALKEKEDSGDQKLGIIQIPEKLNRFLSLGNSNFILMEQIIAEYGKQLFDDFEVTNTYIGSLTRNADIDLDDDDYDIEEDYRTHMSKLIKQRRRLAPVRLELNKAPSKELEDFFKKNLGIKKNRIFETTSPVRLGYLFAVADSVPEEVKEANSDKPYTPQVPYSVSPGRSVMEQVRKEDLLLSYPYESMEPVIRLLEEAANDPDVVSIKITLYRIAKDSQVAKQLIAAAENGKDVVVLMELRARFDEENNIVWSAELEKAGCRVIYGYNNFKCHSKVLLITRMANGEPEYITQVATGNYNEKTAKLYTDFALITSRKEIGLDAQSLFEHFLLGRINEDYDQLMVSPKSMQDGLEAHFNREIEKAEGGEDAYIRLKLNSISDRGMIDLISKASNAGVKIDMMVRGITCILPGVPNRTENVHIYSVVGRYLEHHRVYQFGRGEEAKLYISSADFMTRNIRKRVEVACPILDEKLHARILNFLDIMFHDDVKIRELLSNGNYVPVQTKEGIIAQEELMKLAMERAGNSYAEAQKVEMTTVTPSGGRTKAAQEPVKEEKGFFKRLFEKIFG